MIRIISNEKRYDQIFIRYLGKDYPIKYGSKIYVANAELTNIDLRFFTNGYNLEYTCDSIDIPGAMEDVFGKDRVKAWLDLDMDFQSEMKRLFGTPRLAFGIIDKLNNVICPLPNPTGDSYNNLSDKPRVNGVALYGDKSSEQLGLVSTEKYSELLTKVEDTLSTSNATLNFVQTHCVEKSSTRLLSDKDRKLLNDLLTSLAVGDNNYVIDNKTLNSILDLYPTKSNVADTLSAYLPKSEYVQKMASIDAKLTEQDSILADHAENMKNYLSLASWETFQTGYVKTVNGRHISDNNNVAIDAGDILVSAGSEGTIRGKLEDIQSSIGTHTTQINGINNKNTTLESQIASISNGTSIVAKAYKDGDGNLINTTYVKVAAYNDKVTEINSEFDEIRTLITTNAASAANTYLTSAALDSYYTKELSDNKFLTKSDALSTYLQSTAIDNYYTKGASDGKFLSTADAMTTYANKNDVDRDYLKKADAEGVYIKNSVANERFVAKEEGKGLSEVNYTNEDAELLANAVSNAETAISDIRTICMVMEETSSAIKCINEDSGVVENLCAAYPDLYKNKVYLYNAIDGIYDEHADASLTDYPVRVLGYKLYCLKPTQDTLYMKWLTGLPSCTASGTTASAVCKEIGSMISSNSSIGSYFYFDEGNDRFVIKITGNSKDGHKMAKVVCVLPKS